MTEELTTKAEKLALTGAVAGTLRANASTAKRRRVALVNADGEVTGYTDLATVQEALLAKHALEIEVQPDIRPTEVICEGCGKPIVVKHSGKPRKKCDACLNGKCVDCGKVRKARSRTDVEGLRCQRCRIARTRRFTNPDCEVCGKPVTNAQAYAIRMGIGLPRHGQCTPPAKTTQYTCDTCGSKKKKTASSKMTTCKTCRGNRTSVCERCKKEFSPPNARKAQRYCSQACWGRSAVKNACKRGHERTPDTVSANGTCLACQKQRGHSKNRRSNTPSLDRASDTTQD